MPNYLVATLILARIFFAAAPALADQPVRHTAALLVERLTFGPTLDIFGRIDAGQPQDFAGAQLAPASLPQPEFLARTLAALPLYAAGPVELFRVQSKAEGDQSPEAVAREAASQALAARLARAAVSPRQLEAIMADFWLELFLPDTGRNLARLWRGAFEREVVLPHALGRFEDLLGAALRHPAMIAGFDNWLSSAPGGPGVQGAPGALNRNLAQAVLADMTLGRPKAEDVQGLALVLTGWSLGAPREPGDVNGVCFDARRHAAGPKRFLDSIILDVGRGELDWAISRLAAHPATAKFICSRLAAHFLRGQPAAALTDKLAAVYRDSGGAVGEVLRALCDSREFAQSAKAARPAKSDFEYAVFLARLLGPEAFDYPALARALTAMGAPLFGREPGQPVAPSPSKRSLAARKSLAERMRRGEFFLSQTSLPSAEAVLAALPGRFTEAQTRKILALPEADQLPAILTSDEISLK
jgi:uncharacterized protein (DUF1800 family)